jgi:SAM-dependent methyltransferase
VSDITDLSNINQKYDVVIVCGVVLEHAEHTPEIAYQQVNTILKEQGLFIHTLIVFRNGPNNLIGLPFVRQLINMYRFAIHHLSKLKARTVLRNFVKDQTFPKYTMIPRIWHYRNSQIEEFLRKSKFEVVKRTYLDEHVSSAFGMFFFAAIGTILRRPSFNARSLAYLTKKKSTTDVGNPTNHAPT